MRDFQPLRPGPDRNQSPQAQLRSLVNRVSWRNYVRRTTICDEVTLFQIQSRHALLLADKHDPVDCAATIRRMEPPTCPTAGDDFRRPHD